MKIWIIAHQNYHAHTWWLSCLEELLLSLWVGDGDVILPRPDCFLATVLSFPWRLQRRVSQQSHEEHHSELWRPRHNSPHCGGGGVGVGGSKELMSEQHKGYAIAARRTRQRGISCSPCVCLNVNKLTWVRKTSLILKRQLDAQKRCNAESTHLTFPSWPCPHLWISFLDSKVLILVNAFPYETSVNQTVNRRSHSGPNVYFTKGSLWEFSSLGHMGILLQYSESASAG